MTDSLGLDFGTTNTVAACLAPDGGVDAVNFTQDTEARATFRSALCFWRDDEGLRPKTRAEAGPWAIEKFLEYAEDCRFMQSLKSFAGSKHFDGTFVFGKRFGFEDLLATFFERLQDHGGTALNPVPKRLVIGRPVEFVGLGADGELAMKRYRTALKPFGFDEIHYVYEPVAAAFHYAQRITRDATILVADFGGGTTDFSLMRFSRQSGQVSAEALAYSGVGVAGDNFDYRIIDNVVSPLLGKGSRYRSLDKELEIPVLCYTHFARWNLLSVLRHKREFNELKELLRWSQEPEKLGRFIDLVESEHSYSLYKAVGATKEALSHDDHALFAFRAAGMDLQVDVARSDFEQWIAPELQLIRDAMLQALERSGLAAADVDQVFLTGGTSFVPAVRALFEETFGADRLSSGDEFLSIASGLALIGERDDIDRWTVAAA